jgi:hypothetical protein
MSRLLRRSASVVLVLFALVAVEARAGNSYLFGATQEDIDATMRYYFPRGYDRDAAFRQMSSPFDCRNFGDLCREVGEDYAYRMVEIVWQKARRQMPLDMIARATEQQYDDLSLRWFERLYPEGIDERDPYWGVVAAAGTPSPCEDTVSATSSDGKTRVTHKSRRHVILAVVWGRIQLEHYRKKRVGQVQAGESRSSGNVGERPGHRSGRDSALRHHLRHERRRQTGGGRAWRAWRFGRQDPLRRRVRHGHGQRDRRDLQLFGRSPVLTALQEERAALPSPPSAIPKIRPFCTPPDFT